VVVKDGAVDAADKDGGGLGYKITRLTKFVQALIAADKAPPAGFVIAIDEKLAYRLLVEVLFSVKSAGVRRFGILGKTGKSLGVVPLTLPDKVTSAVNGKLAPPRPTPVKPVVTLTKSRVLLWSISGLEGTLKDPKLTLGRSELAKLTAGLAEIATRRFGDAKRAADDRQIIVMADAATSIKDVIDVLVAVRTTGEGEELFSDVLLSTGFE
jgi:biopolymer transport protein ExbD